MLAPPAVDIWFSKNPGCRFIANIHTTNPNGNPAATVSMAADTVERMGGNILYITTDPKQAPASHVIDGEALDCPRIMDLKVVKGPGMPSPPHVPPPPSPK
jgi:hypothetical protein